MVSFLEGSSGRLLARPITCGSWAQIKLPLPVNVRRLDVALELFKPPLFPHTASHAGAQVIRSHPGVPQASARCNR
jgi:hypothetical protein